MKILLTLLALFFLQTVHAKNPTANLNALTCPVASLIENIDEDTGKISWANYDFRLNVVENSAGNYGYVATYLYKGEFQVESDTLVTNYPKDAALQYYSAYEMGAFTSIDPEKINSALHVNVGVEDNSDDANGYELILMLDKNNILLGKVIRYGWGIGVCRQ